MFKRKRINRRRALSLQAYMQDRREEGNTFIMIIMLMPLMLVCLAFGLQTSLNNYTKNTLQSALDQATQSAVGQAINGDGTQQTIRLGSDLLANTNRLYDKNRIEKLNNLLCSINGITPGSDGVVTNGGSGCAWRQTSWRIYTKNGNQYFEMKLHDYSRVPFGTLLDQGYQTYTIVSTARITGTSG